MDELEFHKLMLEYVSASDEKPKNYIELKGKPQGTSGFKRFRQKNTLAYDERYHKWKIMEILEYSIISGYEVDSSIYYTGFDGLMYKKINVGNGCEIVISREDYQRLWDEAFKKANKGEPYIKIQGTTSTPLSNPFSKEEYIRRFRERRRY